MLPQPPPYLKYAVASRIKINIIRISEVDVANMRRASYESLASCGKPMPSLGRDMRPETALDFDGGRRVFCNQGGYGVCPKRVIKYRHELFDEMESNPDSWFRLQIEDRYFSVLAQVADFLGSRRENLVFVPNVTTGNTVAVGSALSVLRPGKKILRTSLTFHSTGFMVEDLSERSGAEIVTLKVRFPIDSVDDAVAMFEKACQDNPDIAVAVVDHISSSSAVFWPVARIAAALKYAGVERVIVDGAHGPGQVADLDLESLGRAGVDFYSANLHKWGLAPRGCAVMWCRPELQESTMPPIISHNHHLSFQQRFYQQGTKDYSNYLAVEGSLSFLKELGGVRAIQAHTGPLLDWAQDMLAKALGTGGLQVPKSMEAPYMRVIGLPSLPEHHDPPTFDSTMDLTGEIISEFNVGLYVTAIDGRAWIRISAGIYSCKEDYLRVRDALVKKFNIGQN